MPLSLSKSKVHVSGSMADDYDTYNVEYSFAEEYLGPPVNFVIPGVDPVDVRLIPVAYLVSSPSSPLDDTKIPVVQPILKRENGKRKASDVVVASRRITRGEFQASGKVFPCDINVEQSPEEVKNDDARPHVVSESDGPTSSENSQEQSKVSGISAVEDVSGNPEIQINTSSRYVHNLNSEIVELSSSSSDSSDEILEDTNTTSNKGKRRTLVTFRSQKENVTTPNGDAPDVMTRVIDRPMLRVDAKKGSCYRCGKANRLTEKEVCIVCGAKYCMNCLLRAMGSMEEGRKCITCIGFQIDESNRAHLGKSSRMLKRVLTRWEVKRVMRAELSCEVNQLAPHLVCVNTRPLSVDELTALQRCNNPPKNLKPGNYWYDKVSGYWGKEGHKPCQIISTLLNMGEAIKRDASNGNTKVVINDREITKTELWMLQMAGVNCEGNTHFWMSADGAVTEVGQKNVRGRLWDKPRVKLISAALSLPIPPQHVNETARNGDAVVSEPIPENIMRKILLVGCDQSGTNTVYKQAKNLYDVPLSETEHQSIKFMIKSNMYRYIAIVLESRLKFEEDCLQQLRAQRIREPGPSVYMYEVEKKTEYSISQRLEAFSDVLIQAKLSGNMEAFSSEATEECPQLVEELLHSTGFQAAYNQMNELNSLPKVADYLFSRAVEISREEYEPSQMDILHAEDFTSSNGVACMEFSFPIPPQDEYLDSSDQKDPLMRYQLISVQASNLGQNCKWLHMFEDVDLVVLNVSLTDYNESYVDSNGVCINNMMASKAMLETIITQEAFSNKSFLLLLTKFHLLEEEVKHNPLSQCDWFQDFNPVVSYHRSKYSNPSLAQRAFHYIAVKFKRMFSSLTGRKLYVTSVNDLEADNVQKALKYGREILKWEEERARLSRDEISSETIDASTTS